MSCTSDWNVEKLPLIILGKAQHINFVSKFYQKFDTYYCIFLVPLANIYMFSILNLRYCHSHIWHTLMVPDTKPTM